MPVFIFIAGYFHRNQNVLCKFYFFVVSGFLLKILLFTEYRVLYKKGTLLLGVEGNIPWFMFAMAGFILISYIVKDCQPKLVLIVSIIVGCFVGYDKSINDFLVLSRIFVFFPFYYAGILVSNNEYLKSLLYLRTYQKMLFSIIWLILFFTICMIFVDHIDFLRQYFRGRFPYFFIWGANYSHIKSILIRLLCYGISFFMGISLITLTPNRYLPIVSEMGRKTLQIYFWHIFFIEILRKTNILYFAFRENIVYPLLLAVILTLLLGCSLFSFPTKNIKDGCFVKGSAK